MEQLAIDLGTSSTVAVTRGGDGRVRPVLFDGREQLPSGVHAAADGVLTAGVDAERLARAEPGAFEPNPKRRVDDGTVLLGSQAVPVAEVLAAVLRAVVARVDEPGAVVLTVPSSWGVLRRQVLTDAAERAGLTRVQLVSEPVAAAVYYATALGQELPPTQTLLVVDVGAGTADVALVRDGVVIAEQGLDVGGLDVDAGLVDVLRKTVAPEVWRRLAEPETGAERRDRLVLWQEVRAAKESLSRLSVAPVHVPGCEADLHLTREELEGVAGPLLAPVVDVAAELAERHPPVGVFLVGGGSRLPLLARLLHARLGIAPSVVERPETVVAEGALLAQPVVVKDQVPPKRQRRWLSPTTLVLVLLTFLLPFATVSCGLPDGYGRAKTGGTTQYSGVDLAIDTRPEVQKADQVRPEGEWREDRLGVQPSYVVSLLLIVTALVMAAQQRNRRLVAGLAALAAILLAVGQGLVVHTLTAKVREQSVMPAGKTARDFVGTGAGFWVAIGLLALVVAGNLVRRRRGRGS